MPSNHAVISIAEARLRAQEALEDLDRGRRVDPHVLGDLISAVIRLADQFEQSRKELADVQAEYVQMEYVHLSLVETWNKVMELLPRVGLHLHEYQDQQSSTTFSFSWEDGPKGVGYPTLPDALEASLVARLRTRGVSK